MKISNLLFGANIKIPERREDGTYELADYTLGCLNNFGVGTAGLAREEVHSLCRFGDNHGVEEGLAWPIFAGRNSRKKTFNGSAVRWWLSSRNSPTYARYAIINGVAGYNYSSFTFGVVPAFVIPQSVQIDDTQDNGSYRLTELTAYYNVMG